MRRAACALISDAVLVAIATGAVQAGMVTGREGAIFVLIALVWYPSHHFINYLSGWDPRPPPNQDRT